MPHPPRKRPGKKRRSSPPHQAYDVLERWIRERMSEALGADGLPAHIELRLPLSVQLKGRGRADASDRFARTLAQEVERYCEQAALDQLGYRSGHVFCHWCSQPICEHSIPPNHRAVFEGYEPTGLPKWRDFTSWIVSRKDPRVDRVFEERATPLVVTQDGSELVGDLLPEFRQEQSPYRILSQAVGGLFPLRVGSPDPELLRGIAVSAQLIERRLAGGDPQYSLNLICGLQSPLHLPTLISERVSRLLTQYIAGLRQELGKLEDELRSARSRGRRVGLMRSRDRARRTMDRAPALLDKFLRRRGRRTRHAEERTRDPSRPTASAHTDTLRAATENLFEDREEATFIVRGPRNRVHVYRADGTHITSIVYPGETIRDRLRKKRWVRLTAEAAEELRNAVRSRAANEPDNGSTSADQ